MKKLPVIFSLILSMLIVGCGGNKSSNLHPEKIEEKYGYINTEGSVVISAQFDYAAHFSEGLAIVKINGKVGFINQKGEQAIKAEFDGALPFSEGLAGVSIDGNPFKMIPISGSSCGFIDKNGRWVINPFFEEVKKFSEGIAAVRIEGKWGFVDKSGKFVINPEYSSAENFSEGFAFVISYREYSNLRGLIDKMGKFLNTDYVPNGSFSDGLAEIIDPKTHLSGWVNKKGECVIEPKFLNPAYFIDGLARVRISEKYAYIDKSGIIQTIQQFDYASYNYSEGLAAVKLEGNYGFIDKRGEIVIKTIYDSAENFKNGLADVTRNEKKFKINKAGKTVWP